MAMKLRQLFEVKWDTKGEVVCGHLLKVTPVKFKDGGSNVNYLVKRATDGTIVAFGGTTRLNQMLFASDIGALVEVKYVGTDGKEVKAGMSPAKVFEVGVDEDNRIPVGNNDPGITDADIPF